MIYLREWIFGGGPSLTAAVVGLKAVGLMAVGGGACEVEAARALRRRFGHSSFRSRPRQLARQPAQPPGHAHLFVLF